MFFRHNFLFRNRPFSDEDIHYVKSVHIRSFSGPYFLAFGLNTERYSVSLRIQSGCGKIRTGKTPNTDTFHAVIDKTQHNIILKAAIVFSRGNLRHVLNKMDMVSSFWRQAIWVDFFNRNNVKWSRVEYFLSSFSDGLQYDPK